MSIKKHIPNALTLLNLFCGASAIIFCLYNQYQFVPYLIFASLLADFLDGFVARLLKVKSDLGAQLDSLADMTTFGVLPSVMVFMLLQMIEKNNQLSFSSSPNAVQFSLQYLVAFVYALGAALRLAKFNIDTRQTVNFIGVPTPAGAMFVLGIYVNYFTHSVSFSFLYQPIFLLIITLLISILLISELPLFSLKGNPLNHKENKFRFIFLLTCIPQIIIFKWFSLTTIIISYIFFSFIEYITKRNTSTHEN